MTKRVVVVASGETERQALPHLLARMTRQGVAVDEIRIPPNNRALNARICERVIKAVWYEKVNTPSAPDKFVIVVDSDKRTPQDVIEGLREELSARLSEIGASVQYAYACQHLEAWYFADARNLRKYLGKSLGSVDTSKPDNIDNPKHHLINLLGGRIYTAQLSAEIAQALDAKVIADRSPSFGGVLAAIANGDAA